jgi:hypothetical protein
VKSGDIRDLRGVVEREKAAMGWLITLEAASKPMRKEATDSGFYTSPWGKHGRVQRLTVEELLDGKQFSCPPIRPSGTTFKLPRRVVREGDQAALSFEGANKRRGIAIVPVSSSTKDGASEATFSCPRN